MQENWWSEHLRWTVYACYDVAESVRVAVCASNEDALRATYWILGKRLPSLWLHVLDKTWQLRA